MSWIDKIRAGIARVAAAGGVKRRGFGALSAYGARIEGQGYIKHKSGPRKGQTTRFKLKGGTARDNEVTP